jgi:hypothetical protein
LQEEFLDASVHALDPAVGLGISLAIGFIAAANANPGPICANF